MQIIRYTPERAAEWDRFVDASRNGTFLFKRAYMDYHADRFTDHSLMTYDERDSLIALLPASAEGSVLSSHGGLTYGGWVTTVDHCGPAVMLDMFDALRVYMAEAGFTELIYKPVPPIYHRYPAQDDVYALFRHGAIMDGCMVSATIPLDAPLLMSGNNRRDAAKALRAGFTVDSTTTPDTLTEFWEILTRRLREAHDTAPVHSLEEMVLLHSHFPDNIRLLAARSPEGEMAGGMLLYIAPPVIHTQYIATTESGRRHNANALLTHAISEVMSHSYGVKGEERDQRAKESATSSLIPLTSDLLIRYLDFGTSCAEWGRVLNTSLAAQKERLGGRTTLYTRYRLKFQSAIGGG